MPVLLVGRTPPQMSKNKSASISQPSTPNISYGVREHICSVWLTGIGWDRLHFRRLLCHGVTMVVMVWFILCTNSYVGPLGVVCIRKITYHHTRSNRGGRRWLWMQLNESLSDQKWYTIASLLHWCVWRRIPGGLIFSDFPNISYVLCTYLQSWSAL